MEDNILDPTAFNHFKEIPCDKCGSVCSYSNPEEVTECFGCQCKRLEEMVIKCECGWTGNYFEQAIEFDSPKAKSGRLDHRSCPKCGKKRHAEKCLK